MTTKSKSAGSSWPPRLWPVYYALKQLTATEEAAISALVRRAIS